MSDRKTPAPNDDSYGSGNLERFQHRTYRDAWSAYRTADLPFGNSDIGMLIWFTYQQATRLN